ncbi:MAG TPA: SCP2 sterol-binding domain-containing protein [Methylophilaceae bacterium]|jgi:ubiquinone biosynthesis protein UbiJ
MFKPALTRLLNHLINQNSWARPQLQHFAGKAVRFNIPPVSGTLTILEDGGLAMAGESIEADAIVTIPLPVALRLLANDDAATTLTTLEGDTELAAALSKVLRSMQWEYEEDLSKLIGDIPAHEFAEFGRKAVDEVKKQAFNAAEMLAEYWQEEQPLIAKKRHVEQFIKDVDALRDDTERLAKRVEKLAEKITPQSNENPSS